MKKIIMILLSFITTTLLVVGCSSSKDIQDFNIDKIALDEAKKITSEQGYTLKSETLTESDILIGDSEVFTLIKEASIKYEELAHDKKIQALSRIKYRNSLREAIYKLADEQVEN